MLAGALALAGGGCALGTGATSLAPSAVAEPRASGAATASWTCDMLKDALDRDVAHIAHLEAEGDGNNGGPPKSLARLFSFGIGPPAPSSEEQIAAARKEADEYNGALKAKACETVDIDAALKAASQPAEQTDTSWPKTKGDSLWDWK